MRYFIEFSYQGTHYHGWQMQPDAISVQEVLSKALHLLLREPVEIVGAGRTDAGVHALQMFAHFDTDQAFDNHQLVKKMNSFLPNDISVHRIRGVSAEAHARFDATARTYEYRIHQQKNPFLSEFSWYYFRDLDVDAMNEAAQIILMYEDFECFSKTHTDVFTFNCTITEAYWRQEKDQLIFTVSANRFLRNMVRAIVGTLINVGIGKLKAEDMHQIIKSKNRGQAGFSVPAHGLFLTKVRYPYI